jgi:heat shock protein HslJ
MSSLRAGLIALLLLVACGPSEKDAGPPSDESRATLSLPTAVVWKWVGVRGGDPVSVEMPGRYTLEFHADGRYSVRADCNSGSGAWSFEQGVLELQPGPMTLASCGPETLDQRFLQLLSTVTSFATEEGRLLLMLGDGASSMTFEAMRDVGLVGSSWLVRAYNNGREAVVSVLGESQLDLTFQEDGTVTGSAGCNRFNASYAIEAGHLTIGPVAATRKMCPPEELMAQETAFLAALQSVATFEIRGGRAQLRTAEGALAVDLVAAVTGRVRRGEGPAIPRGAVLRIQLQDVSRADAVAPVLAEQVVALQGQSFPVGFELEFDPAEILPQNRYAVRATISSGAGLLYTTTVSYPVLTADQARYGMEIVLEPVER